MSIQESLDEDDELELMETDMRKECMDKMAQTSDILIEEMKELYETPIGDEILIDD